MVLCRGKKTHRERLLGEEWDSLNLHDYANLGIFTKSSQILKFSGKMQQNPENTAYRWYWDDISKFPNDDAAACQICFP